MGGEQAQDDGSAWDMAEYLPMSALRGNGCIARMANVRSPNSGMPCSHPEGSNLPVSLGAHLSVVEVLRCIAILVGISELTFLATFALTDRGRQASDRLFRLGSAVFLVFSVVQEWQQLGKPFVWWRLPLLLIGIGVTAAAIYFADAVRLFPGLPGGRKHSVSKGS